MPTRSLLFSFDILGTVGVLPEDALNVFFALGMSIEPLKGEGPIKAFSNRFIMLHRFKISWHPKAPLSTSAAQQVITHIKQLFQKANLPGNYGELQVLINFPIFAQDQPADYVYIDVPWNPHFYKPSQTRMIHETLRASEIPHAFHKSGFRVYTSPVNFQVANAALANKEQARNLVRAAEKQETLVVTDGELLQCLELTVFEAFEAPFSLPFEAFQALKALEVPFKPFKPPFQHLKPLTFLKGYTISCKQR